MKILITGVHGFVGANLVKALSKEHTIYGLDTVAGESANAWNDYVILSKFFNEYYGEHWDNYD